MSAKQSIEGYDALINLVAHDIGLKIDKTNKLLQMIYEQNIEATQLEPTTEDIPDGLKEYLAARDVREAEKETA